MARQPASDMLSTEPSLSVCRRASLDREARLAYIKIGALSLSAEGLLSAAGNRVGDREDETRAGRVPRWDPGLPLSLEEDRTSSFAHSLLVNLDFFP